MSTLDKRNPIAKAVRTALFAGAAASVFVAPSTFAAEQEQAEEQKVTITGSRIKRTDIETASLVSITPAEEIKLSGFTRIEDLMNSLPQVEASETAFLANGASGTASLDLRGLGSQRTLVLVNGRRLQPGGVYSQSPDVNQIPSALVKRVEVLTGGGSATYGADAVAGVVNFVMDKEFEGVELTIGGSGYQHDNDNAYIQGLMDARNFEYESGSSGIDGKSYNVDLTMGGSFDGGKGHATVYATWRKINELRQSARDYSSCALNGAGTGCGGSGNAIVPNFYLGSYDPVTGVSDYHSIVDQDPITLKYPNFRQWTLDPSNSGFVDSTGNVYNYAPVNHFMRPDKRLSLGAFVEYEVNEHVRPYLEVSYMRDRTVAQIAESGTFFNEEYHLDYDSPLINDAQRAFLTSEYGIGTGDQFATYIGKRNVEGGPRASLLEHNSFRIVAGSEGELSDDWSYDTSLQFGSTSSSAGYVNDFFGPRITTALNSDLCAETKGCIPYEVFTYNGVTAEQAKPLTGVAILTGVTQEFIMNAYVTGDFGVALPSAETTMAGVFGVEYREEKFESLSDEVYEQGLLLGQGGPTPSLTGEYDVKEIFTEMNIPIVEGVTGIESLNLELGLRYSDYNTSGGESTYKVGFDWAITDNYKIRGSANRAVRAPNVGELFSVNGIGLWTGSDPCANKAPKMPELSAEQCALTGMTSGQYGTVTTSPANQYNQIAGGNPDLQPEIADTLTFGLVANPIEDLNFSIDYYDIQIEDVIGTVGSELTIRQCATTGAAEFCDKITRSPSGSLWLGQNGFVDNPTINLASRHWQGIDVSANHKFEALDGTFTTKLVGTFMTKKEVDPVPNISGQSYDCVSDISTNCFAQPEWRHSLTTTYDPSTSWTVSAKWRYFGEVNYNGTTDTLLLADGGIKAQSYLDLKGSYDFNENVSLLVGVNNILDKEPPLVGGTLATNANTVAGFYDTLGRYLHASVTMRF